MKIVYRPNPIRVLIKAFARFCLVLSFGFGLAAAVLQEPLAQAQKLAFDLGYKKGLENQDWKSNMVSDQSLMNKVCYVWWFGAGVKDNIKRK